MTRSPRRAAEPAREPLPRDVRWADAAALACVALAAVLGVATALLWASRQPMFAIRSVTVGGDVAKNSVATIRANAAPHLAGSYVTMDLAAVRRAFEAVPWVRKAVVRRVWPHRLVVELEEHRPVALWQGLRDDDGATRRSDAEASVDAADRLVNSFGEVFEANLGDVEDDALPTLSGPEGSAARVLAMRGRLAAALAPARAEVRALALSSRGSWTATLEGGVVVELGRGSDDEVLARAGRFVATVGQVTGRLQRPLEYADLRHDGGYAVRLKGVTTTLPATGANAKKAKG